MSPRVSVIIAAYNAGPYIGEALASTLAQTFADFEIILVDDGSTDDTLARAGGFDDPRLRVHRNPANLGIAGASNTALALAGGEYVAIMDADDVMMPERLARQVAFLDANPGIAVCGSELEMFGGEVGRTNPPAGDSDIKANFVDAAGNIANPSAMFRRDFVMTHGLRWNTTYATAADFAFWIDCMRAGAVFANLKEPLVRYRRHAASITQRQEITRACVRRIRKGLFVDYFPHLTGTEIGDLLGLFEGGDFSFNALCGGVAAALKARTWAGSQFGENRERIRHSIDHRLEIYRKAILKA